MLVPTCRPEAHFSSSQWTFGQILHFEPLWTYFSSHLQRLLRNRKEKNISLRWSVFPTPSYRGGSSSGSHLYALLQTCRARFRQGPCNWPLGRISCSWMSTFSPHGRWLHLSNLFPGKHKSSRPHSSGPGRQQAVLVSTSQWWLSEGLCLRQPYSMISLCIMCILVLYIDLNS